MMILRSGLHSDARSGVRSELERSELERSKLERSE